MVSCAFSPATTGSFWSQALQVLIRQDMDNSVVWIIFVVEFWGLPPLILFFKMSTGWLGRFVLSTIVNQNKEAWLQESKLAKMLCTGHREFGTNRWKFLPKVKHFIF